MMSATAAASCGAQCRRDRAVSITRVKAHCNTWGLPVTRSTSPVQHHHHGGSLYCKATSHIALCNPHQCNVGAVNRLLHSQPTGTADIRSVPPQNPGWRFRHAQRCCCGTLRFIISAAAPTEQHSIIQVGCGTVCIAAVCTAPQE